jgi:hypothetical protein
MIEMGKSNGDEKKELSPDVKALVDSNPAYKAAQDDIEAEIFDFATTVFRLAPFILVLIGVMVFIINPPVGLWLLIAPGVLLAIVFRYMRLRGWLG